MQVEEGQGQSSFVPNRPDMPFPYYKENGERFKNVYLPAGAHRHRRHRAVPRVHGALPAGQDAARVAVDWMAHKQCEPEIPGTAVLFVADTDDGVREGKFGTGRGMFFNVMHTALRRGILAGRRTSTSSMARAARRPTPTGCTTRCWSPSTRPSPRRRRTGAASVRRLRGAERHRRPGAEAIASRPSTGGVRRHVVLLVLVACNHADALAIPAKTGASRCCATAGDDRRRRPRSFAAWMEQPGNIAALSRFLAKRSLKGFNMFWTARYSGQKPKWQSWHALRSTNCCATGWTDPACGLAFTKMQIERAIANNLGAQNTFWRGEFKAAWNVFCARLVRSSGSTRRTLVEGTQRKLFCFRSNKARVDKMPEAALRREVGKWGGMELLKTALSGLPGGRGLDEKDD